MAAKSDSGVSGKASGRRGGALSEYGVSMMARMPEFHYLTKTEVEDLTRLGPQVYKPGEAILESGEKNRMLVILLAGICRIEYPVVMDGERRWVCVERVHAPAVLGEVSIFATRPRSATVITDKKSVAIMVSSKALRDRLEGSGATLPRMFWSFARLGLARIRNGAGRLEQLLEKHLGRNAAGRPDYETGILRLEKVIGPTAEKSNVDEETFDQISVLLERVDGDLGFVSYLDQMSDGGFPAAANIPGPGKSALPPLAAAALEKMAGGASSIKEKVAQAAADNPGLLPGGWMETVLEFIRAVDEIHRLAPLVYEARTKRSAQPGSEEMIEGFADRIERELDSLEDETMERFGIESLEKLLSDKEAAGRLDGFLSRRVKKIKARVSVEDFEAGSLLDDYHQPGEDIRNRAAMEIFNRLSSHPVMSVIMAGSCRRDRGCADRGAGGGGSLLDFFCLGCRLAYPDAGERDAESRTPYPV
ncbi:MAG: Crp/Fnr family transcriptional regulator [Candidatus Nitrospinota bacterium M3_3B_026]